MTVGDQETISGGIHDRIVRDRDAVWREAPEFSGREVEPEDGGGLQVTNKQRLAAEKGEAEDEAAGAGDALDLLFGWIDSQNLAILRAAPDPPVWTNGDTFWMLQTRITENAVEENTGTVRGKDGLLGSREMIRHQLTLQA